MQLGQYLARQIDELRHLPYELRRLQYGETWCLVSSIIFTPNFVRSCSVLETLYIFFKQSICHELHYNIAWSNHLLFPRSTTPGNLSAVVYIVNKLSHNIFSYKVFWHPHSHDYVIQSQDKSHAAKTFWLSWSTHNSSIFPRYPIAFYALHTPQPPIKTTPTWKIKASL